MIRKLRVKLIFASMLSLFIVLLVIMGTISVLNYRSVTGNADEILALLAENDGAFPDVPVSGEQRSPGGDPRKRDALFSPELPYESRYFFVFF